MKLTEIRTEFLKLRNIARSYIGRTFKMDGSIIGLQGEYLFKIDEMDIVYDVAQVSFYSPEEGFEEESPWVLEFIPFQVLEDNARWTTVKSESLEEVLPWGQNFLNEERAALNEKTQKALEALDAYEQSEKSAQDAAHLICTIQEYR